MTTTHEAMTPATWRAVRHALAFTLAHNAIGQVEYDRAMTEVMGTSEKSKW